MCLMQLVSIQVCITDLSTAWWDPVDSADFILVNDLEEFNVIKTYIRGQLVAENGKSFIPSRSKTTINHFNARPMNVTSLADQQSGESQCYRVLTVSRLPITCGCHRKNALPIMMCWRLRWLIGTGKPNLHWAVSGTWLEEWCPCLYGSTRQSTISFAVGVDDASMARVINELIKSKGSLAATDGTDMKNSSSAGSRPYEWWRCMASEVVIIPRSMILQNNVVVLPSGLLSCLLSFMALPVIPP